MPLVNILVIIVVIGFLLWMINTYIPMDNKIKKIFNIVVVIAVIIWLLKILGLFNTVMNYKV
ncbi:hypothetical protein EGI22_03880 [Lacihabitans sp. LS3-19]|nr:hypothetical protein [Lacihabitans sp. LS3-19]